MPAPPSTLVLERPPVLDALVLRALEKDPERRFQSASEMRAALAALAVRPAAAKARQA